eukprot:1649772-Prymnesium_polylepis.1
MERKEIDLTPDVFWSREPIIGHKGTKENPAIIPSFNTSRVVGLETEQVCGRVSPGCKKGARPLCRCAGGGEMGGSRALTELLEPRFLKPRRPWTRGRSTTLRASTSSELRALRQPPVRREQPFGRFPESLPPSSCVCRAEHSSRCGAFFSPLCVARVVTGCTSWMRERTSGGLYCKGFEAAAKDSDIAWEGAQLNPRMGANASRRNRSRLVCPRAHPQRGGCRALGEVRGDGAACS